MFLQNSCVHKAVDCRNRLQDIVTVQYLAACPLLEHIYVEGNEEIDLYPKNRQTIKNLVPKLKTLDGSPFTEGK